MTEVGTLQGVLEDRESGRLPPGRRGSRLRYPCTCQLVSQEGRGESSGCGQGGSARLTRGSEPKACPALSNGLTRPAGQRDSSPTGLKEEAAVFDV